MNGYFGEDRKIAVPVSGTELALVLSAVCVTSWWGFERPSARGRITPDLHREVDDVRSFLLIESKGILGSAGVADPAVGPLTQKLILKRVEMQAELALSMKQLPLCVFALRICHEEFVVNWGDFAVLAPGNITWYNVRPDDLLALADKLEAFVENLSDSLGA